MMDHEVYHGEGGNEGKKLIMNREKMEGSME